jgi:hypothetical protein
MRELKNSSFAERQALANDAKKAMLAKFKPKPAVTDPNLDERKAAKAAELEIIRAERQAERERKRAAAEEADQLRREMDMIHREAEEVSLRAKQKAARDARYAARKQRR